MRSFPTIDFATPTSKPSFFIIFQYCYVLFHPLLSATLTICHQFSTIPKVVDNRGLVVCVLRPIDSEVIERRYPNLLSLAKDVKLGFYTVPIGNGTPGRGSPLHNRCATPAPILVL